jgi:hypothetical protein
MPYVVQEGKSGRRQALKMDQYEVSTEFGG